ncbi:MAG: TonB-dependent receptor [Terracidiphilus sp.]
MIASRRLLSHPLRFSLLAVCLFVQSLSFAHAQSATTGAIGGTVSDTGGALLPAAAITVKSLETGVSRTAKTNASGEYRVSELEPGNYSATFTVDGFDTYVENAIIVTVGSLSTVSPVLKPGSVTNSITVTDETPLLHVQSSDISTALDQASIDNLPINGRRWSNFALLTPGVVSNADGFGLLSFRGISFLLNNNTVDGADDNQAYFSEARGRTRAAYSITQAAIQEFQVNTSNYSAQYGRAAGGVINTVTKSGTNQLRGELFFYDRDNDLGGATNPYTLLTVSNGNGTYNQVPYNPTDWRKQWGFGVGGPLRHDKLFWFYAYDQNRRNFPGTGRAPDPNDTFAPSNATLPSGEETCTQNPVSGAITQFTATSSPTYSTEGDYNACAIAATMGVNFQAGSAYYQQGLGIISSFLGTVPRTLDQVINLPKLDYQINERNHLSLMYNRMRESSPNGFQTQASVFYGRGSFGNDFVKEDFGIARLTTIVSDSIVNDALVQYGRDFEYTMSDSPLPNELPLANNAFGRPAEITIGSYFSGSSGFNIGKNEDLDRAADPNEHRLQLLDGATWSHGKHVSKAGLEFNRVVDYVNNLYDGNGNYSYDYSYDFISDYLHATTGQGPAGYTDLYYSYGQDFGNPVGEIATREYAGYATDDWRIRPNLTLTLGARYEYEYIPPNPFPNTGNPVLATIPGVTATALPQTTNRPDDRNNIAPRFGFAWNVFGNNKTTVRGGYGMYFGRIINSNILQTYEDSGAPNGQVSVSSLYAQNCGPVFPNLKPSFASAGGCIGSTTNVAYLDSHMQSPQVHEADLAIERNLGHKTVLAVTYMMSMGRELPSAIDTNLNLTNTALFRFTVAAPTSTVTTACPSGYCYPISTSQADAPPQPPQSGYVTLPHGGAKLPFAVGQTLTSSVKVFLAPANALSKNVRPNPAYGEILDVKSNVNSSYDALAVQINHPFEHGFSLMSNYTWSHSLDDNPYQSTVIPTFNALDPTDLKHEHGNGSLDIRQRFVFAAVYQPQTHFHGLTDKILGGWRIAPIVQIQTGLPYTPYVSGSIAIWSASNPNGLSVPVGTDGCSATIAASEQLPNGNCSVYPAYKGLNGSGSSADRLPWIERNTYHYPKTAVVDARLGKNFFFDAPHFEHMRLELLGEVFNIMNHQNITGIEDEAYTLSSTKGTALTPTSDFGTYTNSNSNWAYSSRQIQVAARLHF